MRGGVPLAALAAALAAGCVGPLASPTPDVPEAPGVAFEALRFETELGAFTAILFCGETPRTCAFVRGLATERYYDGRAFGRVIPGFVIQEVDRTGGTTDQPEKVEAEFGTAVMFSAGALGIARDADPDSGSSEFFVMDHPVSTLYGNYTAFAQVVEGMDVVHAIARVPAVRTGPASGVAWSPPGSPVSFGVHDRVPVDPVAMLSVAPTALLLSPEEAARHPLQVGETVRGESHRATLQWPADLRAGRESALAWYVWPRDASPTGQAREPEPLPLEGVVVEVDGAATARLTPTQREEALGRIGFAWTPPVAGEYRLRLVQDGAELAAQALAVPPG